MGLLEGLVQLCVLGVALELARGQLALPGCVDKCGNISIPYPFGIGAGCYLEDALSVVCREPDKPLVWASSLGVLDISLDGYLRVSLKPSYSCYENYTATDKSDSSFSFTQFAVSDTRNKLLAVGCNGYGIIEVPEEDGYQVGCQPKCLYKFRSRVPNGGSCCQASIPRYTKAFRLSATVGRLWSSSLCNYAILTEDGNCGSVFTDISSLRTDADYPVVLEWWIGQNRCEEVKQNLGSYACKSSSSICLDSYNGPGYRCNCSNGYKGNPYLPNGCQDINECEDPRLNKCIKPESCRNTEGSYTCNCPTDLHGDGKKDGIGCVKEQQSLAWKTILIGIVIGLLTLFLGISWIYWALRLRKIIGLKEKFFERNGGLLLQQQLSKLGKSGEKTRVFSAVDLKKATDNYHESRILGQGGQGTVYKGTLPDNKLVAVKKAKIGDLSQIEQFINELIVVSQINHRNVVKLLGCCLETEVPLLVYEFVINGALFEHMHDPSHPSVIPWETRLKIAAETAGALSYLHSAASIPIIHRDIKSANILLDNKFTAKISDFGASRLIPVDKEQLTTLVQGTLGYLDPEYFHTSHLNEKSDVYSFGLVLLELLTGEKAVSFFRAKEERLLVTNFVTAMKENRLVEILDRRVLCDENLEQFQEAADLAMRCVRLKGEERPTMKEVAVELESLRRK